MSHRNEAHTKMSDEQDSWWSSSSTPCSEINPMPDQIAKALVQLSFKNLQEGRRIILCSRGLGFFCYYYFNLLECTLLQFMTTALFTVLKRVCLIYKAHLVIERLHLSPCFCLLFRLNTWIPLQPVLAHHISRPCSLLVLDSLVFVSLSLSYWCDHNQTDYSRDIPKQQTDGNNHHSPHSSSTVNLHPHSSTRPCSFPTRTRRPFSGMLLLHPPARSSLLNSSIFHSAHAPSLPSSLWVPALPSGTLIPPPKGAVTQELADGAFCSTCWSVLTQFHPSSNSRKDSLWTATDLKLQTIYWLLKPYGAINSSPFIQSIPHT